MLELFALHNLGNEAADEGVTSTIGIDDQVLGD
jgi:hypothetical protein